MDVEIPAQDVTVTSGYQVVSVSHTMETEGSSFSVTVDAPEGTLVVGGGFTCTDGAEFAGPSTQIGPAPDGSSFTVEGQSENAGTVTVYAIVLALP
jgi:hypothetical protein